MSESMQPEIVSGERVADTNGGARSAEEIRAEIEQTREELGQTVEALAEKSDVKARTHEQIEAAKQTMAENVAHARETVSAKAGEMRHRARQATPESAQAGLHQAGTTIQQRPLPYAVVAAFAAGLLIGWMIGRP